MNKIQLILDRMECFPSAFAQPENNISPVDILAFAADYREKAQIPRPERPPELATGALPADFVRPEAWDDPRAYDDPVTGYRYTGNCNGCGHPVYVPEDWRLSTEEKEFLAKSTLETLRTDNGKYEIWGTGGQGPGETADLEFDTLDEALAFVAENAGLECSLSIKYPNGDWHNW